MKLHEAVRAARESNGELWFRPVGWRLACYTVAVGVTKLVPGPGGGRLSMTYDARTLEGEWETLTPDQFFAEQA